jgi:serine/threonine protein kinase
VAVKIATVEQYEL